MMRGKVMGCVIATLSLLVIAMTLGAEPSGASPTTMQVVTHNIEVEYDGAMNYVVNNEDHTLWVVAMQEVCAKEYIGSGRNIWASLAAESYIPKSVQVTRGNSSVCNGSPLLNVVATWGSTDSNWFKGTYVNQPGDAAPNERRGYVCQRASFGKAWIGCSTHLEFRSAGSISVAESSELRTRLGNESSLAIKIMAGDFNVRPRSDAYSGGNPYHASPNYSGYREADQFPYDGHIYNPTKNPPNILAHYNQKIDYVFVGRFWTSDAFGYQDRRCDTLSDHCLVLGAFIAN